MALGSMFLSGTLSFCLLQLCNPQRGIFHRPAAVCLDPAGALPVVHLEKFALFSLRACDLNFLTQIKAVLTKLLCDVESGGRDCQQFKRYFAAIPPPLPSIK